MDVIVSLVSQFVHAALAFVVKDLDVRESLTQVVNAALGMNIREAHAELNRLLQDEARHPITYNHYYTDNIQKARLDRSKGHLKESMDRAINEDWNRTSHISNTPNDINRLLSSLQNRLIVDMTEQACADARTDLAAYYKVCVVS